MENLSRDPVTIQSYLLLFNGLSLRSQDSLLWYCYFPFIFDCLRCGPTTFFRGKRGFFFFFQQTHVCFKVRVSKNRGLYAYILYAYIFLGWGMWKAKLIRSAVKSILTLFNVASLGNIKQ